MSDAADTRCVVVGASHAGVQLATRLRRLGWEGGITLIGEEPHFPYHRPPLSKDYLKGNKTKESMLIHSAAAYEKANIDLMLGQRVASLDRSQRRLTLQDGTHQEYDKLVLATGSVPRRLPVPGADLPGVCYLRNADDVDRIRTAAKSGGRAVIIGGGYIGLEVAASLRILGMTVTVVEAMERVLQRITCEPVSRFFTRVHAQEGVDIRTGVQAEAIVGEQSAAGIRLKGGEVIDADLIVVGIGVVPDTILAADAGLVTSNGIGVNSYMQTSDPDIYAIGDCACFEHPLYAGLIRLESVQNANDQAVVAAKSLMGEPVGYDALPWFWSDQFDVKLQIAGLAAGADQVVLRGDVDTGRNLSALHIKDGRLIAVDAINRPRDFVMGKKLIVSGAMLDQLKLADVNVTLNETVIG